MRQETDSSLVSLAILQQLTAHRTRRDFYRPTSVSHQINQTRTNEMESTIYQQSPLAEYLEGMLKLYLALCQVPDHCRSRRGLSRLANVRRRLRSRICRDTFICPKWASETYTIKSTAAFVAFTDTRTSANEDVDSIAGCLLCENTEPCWLASLTGLRRPLLAYESPLPKMTSSSIGFDI